MRFPVENMFPFVFSVILFVPPLYASPSIKYHLLTSSFSDILKTIDFVDKTLLIQQVLEDSPYLFIPGIGRMGKSTNLDMLKEFFELQIDASNGNPVADIKETAQYKMFVENNLKITHKREIMKKHFGRYPVVWVNFMFSSDCDTFHDVLKRCRRIIVDGFWHHIYLENSTRLSEEDKKMFDKWTDYEHYHLFNESAVIEGFHLLSRLLYIHYNKKCIFLVDEFDSIIRDQLQTEEGQLALDQLQFVAKVFRKLLIGNDVFVEKAIFTGISPILLYPVLENIIETRVSSRHENYVKFYGFTLPELHDLFIRYKISHRERKEVTDYYETYAFHNTTIFNIWSIVRHLNEDQFHIYWRDLELGWSLTEAFDNVEVKNAVETLLQNKSVEINYEMLTKENIDEINSCLRDLSKKSFSDIWFSLMLDFGYFQVISARDIQPNGSSKFRIKFSNLENLRMNFALKLMEYYKDKEEAIKYEEMRTLAKKLRVKPIDYT